MHIILHFPKLVIVSVFKKESEASKATSVVNCLKNLMVHDDIKKFHVDILT